LAFCKNEIPIFHYAGGGFEKVAKSRECFSLRFTHRTLALDADSLTERWLWVHRTQGQRPVSVGGAVLALYFARVEHRCCHGLTGSSGHLLELSRCRRPDAG
jgi:hypothetical protein